MLIDLAWNSNKIDSRDFIWTTTIIAGGSIFFYIINELKEKNPKRFKTKFYNPGTGTNSERFDFHLIENIAKNVFYFSSMSFVILNFIIFLIFKNWAFDIETIIRIFGINTILYFIKAIADIYNFTENECEKR